MFSLLISVINIFGFECLRLYAYHFKTTLCFICIVFRLDDSDTDIEFLLMFINAWNLFILLLFQSLLHYYSIITWHTHTYKTSVKELCMSVYLSLYCKLKI